MTNTHDGVYIPVSLEQWKERRHSLFVRQRLEDKLDEMMSAFAVNKASLREFPEGSYESVQKSIAKAQEDFLVHTEIRRKLGYSC
jgi:hypothetical protein